MINVRKIVGNPSRARDKVFYYKEVVINGDRIDLIYSKTELDKLKIDVDQFDQAFELSLYLIKEAIYRAESQIEANKVKNEILALRDKMLLKGENK